MSALPESVAPLLGEFAWHAITRDPTLDEVSARHERAVEGVLARHGRHLPGAPHIPLQVLEVGAYAHSTGYALAGRAGRRATLADISASALRLGREGARRLGLPLAGTRRVAADFHDLPFEDAQFHLVYICSALHHTERWQQVLAELTRVLAPGGLLYLENEPCQREFCFYRFRANRSDGFTPFERALEDAGALRTIAEPYVGSRPEALFGMIENQRIPLESLRAAVERDGALAELIVAPDAYVGPLERELLDRRGMDAGALEAWLAARLEDLCAQVAPALGETERGLGFSLPSREDIAALARRVVPLLRALPAVRAHGLRRLAGRLARAPGRFFPAAYREELARLFGAAVSLVAVKRGIPPVAGVDGRLRGECPEEDGVVLGFAPRTLRMLAAHGAVLPDLRSSPAPAIQAAFPAPDWELRADGGGHAVLAHAPRARILAPLSPGALVLLRVHAERLDRPYRVALRLDDEELAAMDVHLSESFLLAAAVPRAGALHLGIGEAGARVSVSFAAALPPAD